MNTEAQLADLRGLLGRHADAVRAGDADALPALADALRACFTLLARSPLGAEHANALRELSEECGRTQAWLARRQGDVARSLDALRAAAPEAPLPVYRAQGALAAGLRSRGFGPA